MFAHLSVKNFRCFSDLQLTGLSRVNLVGGKNNTGKTALLEAIHLHANPSSPTLALTINKQRGIEEPAQAFFGLARWLFREPHLESGLELASTDIHGMARALSVFLLDAAAARERFPEAVRSLVEELPNGQWHALLGGLVQRFEQAGEPPRFSWAAPGAFGEALLWIGARIAWRMPSIYLGPGTVAPEQDLRFFGELEAAKRQAEILPALRILEPRLERLALVPWRGEPLLNGSRPVSSLVPHTTTAPPVGQAASPGMAGEAVLHGDIGLPRLIPIALMGAGIRRVLSIVLAIASAPGGVVLIDEIENGLHYSVLLDVWTALAKAARAVGAQVFATTHSWECIEAAHQVFKEAGPYEFKYYRLDRNREAISAKILDERMLDAVEKTDLEVR